LELNLSMWTQIKISANFYFIKNSLEDNK